MRLRGVLEEGEKNRAEKRGPVFLAHCIPTCSRCVKTSMCKNPKKPQRRPEPSDDDWSRTTEMLLSLRHKRSTAVVHNSWGGGKRVVVNVSYRQQAAR